ncbi:hybrid sensor histidine kinase/response regulator [Nodosilinea sp. FACHB-131]|uniref:hybrid sensor histidine kinase/response regulator n=1 Tax=Cyanophyceae TaxID=3028117 RepID=UPI0016864C5C|nr:hybrid sensor histidine kinase/response regulator [Nodosilinea sp. FACHB-131]MBD1875399.1 hybrid sensor histidine kinase/response regulator [Nodosilinea sp. FACHB-131]
MSDAKELEIRLQFLDEAQEYLETLGTHLMGLTQTFEASTINEALRAAHSIKGGAALMGFQLLSDLAHHLEDSLKVLKVQRGKLDIDADLEQLLLAAVDCLSQVMVGQRQCLSQGHQSPVEERWLEHHAAPIFERLHDRLGDPIEEDAYSMLSPEDGQDVIPLLFQSEVEGCLQRLEGVLSEQSPCLREEVQILAQELGGLGEMLQLEAFVSLCQSVANQVTLVAEDDLVIVVQEALAVWRRAQALVLTGHLGEIPTQMVVVGATFESIPIAEIPGDIIPHLEDGDITAPVWPLGDDSALQPDYLEADITDDVAASWSELGGNAKFEFADTAAAHGANIPGTAAPGSPAPNLDEADSDSTVRVPVKQINQLSDLFGELTIERHRLELEVSRLRGLVGTLQTRMRTLDQVNSDLRAAYDRVATQDASAPRLPTAPGLQNGLALVSQTADTTLQSQFDVLELDHYRDLHLPFREIIETIIQLQEVGADIELSLDGTEQTTHTLRKTSRQLQKNLTQLRMRPLADVFDRYPRSLRQMSLQYNKPVELKLKGDRTLVDRNVLEALQEPLMHIIRNCFDHGIEDAETRQQRGKPAVGTIAISAQQQSSRTVITISDDGGGIAVEKIRDRARQMGLDDGLLAAASTQELLSLIFEPGFSTAKTVTDLSGRGIGMDVVRSKLKEIRGDIQVDTQLGAGTTFTISIPFTLSVTRVLITESKGMRMAFPVDAIEEIFALPAEYILATAGRESFEWNGELVQLVRLADWLHFNCPVVIESPETAPAISTPTVMLVRANQKLVGLQVERSWGEQEVALRRVVGNLPMPKGFNSCTIMGDGQVVPLINTAELLYWIASCEASGAATLDDTPMQAYLTSGPGYETSTAARKPTVLLVDDSINVRRLLALTLEKAGYQVAQAKDGQDALDKLTAGLAVEAVICDVEMPRLDGYGFLARLKAETEHEDLPVAMLTSRSSQKHRQLAMSLGAAAYFTKPYNEQTLLKTLEDLIQPVLVS